MNRLQGHIFVGLGESLAPEGLHLSYRGLFA